MRAMAGGTPAQVLAAFGDVAICFSAEEWAELAGWQKDLYRDVMAENFQLVSSLECLLAIPDLLSQLAQGGVPQIGARRPPGQDEECQVVSLEEVAAKSTKELQGPPEHMKKPRISHPSMPGKKPKRPLLQPGGKAPVAGEGEGVLESKASPRTQEKPYKCPKCRRSFPGRIALGAHRRLHIRKWRQLVPQAAGGSLYAPEQAGPTLGDMGTGASPFPSSQGEGMLPFWPEMALHQQGLPAANFNPLTLCYRPQPLPGHQAPGLPSNGEFICDQCGWSFQGWEELVTHQMAHMAAEGIAGSVPKAEALAHLATDRPYACTQCGKSFRHKPNLLAHRQVHTGERRYQCQECGKSFGSKAYLASHQHIHTGEKPYVCAQCGKSFRHKPNLISHQKIHAREPLAHGSPHPLETFNGEAFSSLQHPVPEPLGLDAFLPARPAVDALLSCARGTTPLPQLAGILPPPSLQPAVNRPFVCPVCAKQFRCKPYLVAHIRIHTGEKPYACSRCPKRFSQKSNLVSHERLHTGEKPYACPLCPRVFSQGSNMRAHQRSHRNMTGAEVEGGLHAGYPTRQFQQPN
ncbi:zinc finger protein 300-like [Pseudonaja textilis]|uniref:zinc finger protein 300-like n=1 Tax=Pseudonaja textilis TaxID=8673 RepID=UPI000EAA66D7|nr:zinc finger protein 300-like [Pseudonaja textilis]